MRSSIQVGQILGGLEIFTHGSHLWQSKRERRAFRYGSRVVRPRISSLTASASSSLRRSRRKQAQKAIHDGLSRTIYVSNILTIRIFANTRAGSLREEIQVAMVAFVWKKRHKFSSRRILTSSTVKSSASTSFANCRCLAVSGSIPTTNHATRYYISP